MMKSTTTVAVDIDNIEKTSKVFSDMLKGLEELSRVKTGKLGVTNNVTYLSWHHLQGIHRWYYEDNRVDLKNFLRDTFTEYQIFCEMLNNALSNEQNTASSSKHAGIRLRQIRRKNQNRISSWRDGLNILETTYGDQDIRTFVAQVRQILRNDLLGSAN